MSTNVQPLSPTLSRPRVKSWPWIALVLCAAVAAALVIAVAVTASGPGGGTRHDVPRFAVPMRPGASSQPLTTYRAIAPDQRPR